MKACLYLRLTITRTGSLIFKSQWSMVTESSNTLVRTKFIRSSPETWTCDPTIVGRAFHHCAPECKWLTKQTRSKKACSHSHKTDQQINRSCPNFWTWETPRFTKLYPTSASVRTDRCTTESEKRAQLRGVLASLSHYPHKEHLLDGFGLDMIFLKIFSFRSVSAAASHDSGCWARLGAAAVTPSTGSTLDN